MISRQRRYYLLLFLFWIGSFYIMWRISCEYNIVSVYRMDLRQTHEDTIRDVKASKDISKRLASNDKNQKTNSDNLRYEKLFLNLLNEERDLKKELRKISAKRRCKAVDRVLFVKTHKTGSSTITNILNRFADLRELPVALPMEGTNRFMWPKKFHWTSADLLRLNGETANILCNHARYERSQMDFIMKKNTKYITILRNPVTQFHSSFHYFEFDKALGLTRKKDPLEEFLKDPDKHLYDLSIRLGDLPTVMNLIQNGMLYDLGYDFLDFANETVINKAIQKLESELDLVMLMEYFDESLVLLMREFCWSIDDILYLKMNQMKYNRRAIAESVKAKIRKWNQADVTLYNKFNRTFWERIKRHGEEFWKDLAEFKIRNKEIFKVCGPKEIEEKGFKLNITVKSLILKSNVDRFHRYYCQKMATNEIQYLEYFRAKFATALGYQKILKREGVGPKRTGELTKRIKERRKHIRIRTH